VILMPKLTPASLISQKAWKNFPTGVKRELRKVLPDHDRDGTPNIFDCRPNNPKRQESFLPVDMTYIKQNPGIAKSRKLGSGMSGDVHKAKNNSRLVIKVPREYSASEYGKAGKKYTKDAVQSLEDEAELFFKYHLDKQPLFIPTHMEKKGGKVRVIRPSVTVVVQYVHDSRDTKDPGSLNKLAIINRSKVNERNLRKLHADLQTVTERGFRLMDGLQVGIDNQTGNFVLFDLGYLQKDKPGSLITFKQNNYWWMQFIRHFNGGYAKYGIIAPRRSI